jgi:hypothetical protein
MTAGASNLRRISILTAQVEVVYIDYWDDRGYTVLNIKYYFITTPRLKTNSSSPPIAMHECIQSEKYMTFLWTATPTVIQYSRKKNE